jgi:hypothetical protein
MNTATEDFLNTLGALRMIANELGPAQIGSGVERSPNTLRLNGAKVTAFAALEDFFRRRVLEVIRWLGDSNVKFVDFPQAFRKFLLEETIKGIHFWLQKTDDSERVSFVQLEGLLMDTTINPQVKFEPSDYCFGKSQSNISKGQILDLLNAMMISDGLASLAKISTATGLAILDAPDKIFVRLAKSRHKAAHAFSSNYNILDFKDDLNSNLPLVAFTFDTCISQCAFSIHKSVTEGKIFSSFKVDTITLRRFQFNNVSAQWQEFRGQHPVQDLAKGGLEKRLKKFAKDNLALGETILVSGGNGGIEKWIQPF